MKRFRQVANVSSNDGNFTLDSVIVKIEDVTNGIRTSRSREINQTFTNVNDLFEAIKTNVNQVLSF